MYTGGLKSALRVNVSNIPGWRTNRHIVVIESDDWGSIRMSSIENFNKMLKAGMPGLYMGTMIATFGVFIFLFVAIT